MKILNYYFLKNSCRPINKVLICLVLFLGTFLMSMAQIPIKGKILDENDSPMAGVSILIKGTTTGTVTNIDGEFSLQANEGDVLVINMVGYLTEEIPITAATGSINLKLSPDLIGLEQVVVVGYGTQRKGDLTAAISNVNADEFVKGSVKDMGQLLQGKVAGLNITTPDGNPSSSSQITLRGQVSIGTNSDVLIIIDGVPALSEKNQDGYSQSVDPLKLVAPQDIENITVLKDGSASAIYGARGNNGVIIITTKQGKKNQGLSLEYNTQVSTEFVSKRSDMLDADDFMRMQYDTLPGGENILKLIQPVENPTKTDWFKEITRTPFSQMHNLTIRGGKENTGYVANLNYNKAQGIFIKSQVENLKARFNINQSMFDDKLTLSAGILSGFKNDPTIDPGLAYRNSLTRNPTDRVKDDEGNWQERDGFQYYNPVSILNEETSMSKERYNWLNGSVTYNPIKGLYLKLMVGHNTWNMNWSDYQTLKHFESLKNGHNGIAKQESQNTTDKLLEYTMEYTKMFGNHTVTLLGGYSYSDHVWERTYMQNENFPSDIFGYNNIGQGAALVSGKNVEMTSEKNSHKLIGFFGRINYNFSNKYLLQASIRHEGSSKFGANNKWGNFPSFQAGWRVKNESFLKDIGFISELKLRFGYGVTGEVPNESYLSLSTIEYDANRYFYYNGNWLASMKFTQNANPDLRWEKKTEYNYGIDWGVFNSRLSGSFDIYNRLTSDLLYNYAVPVPPNRADHTWANVGSMRNKGVEVLLNVIPVQRPNFEWTSTFSFSANKNKLESLEDANYKLSGKYLSGGYTGDPIQMSTHRMYVGQPVGDIYGYKVVGYYATTYKKNKKAYDTLAYWNIDRPEIKEILDGEGNVVQAAQEADTVKYSSRKDGDIQKLGNGIPKYFMSWSNTVRYKNFDLTFSLRGAFGFQILNFERMFYDSPNASSNTLKSAYKRYKTEYVDENDNIQYGYYMLGETGAVTSLYVENGDYLKIDNITLGYNFQPKKTQIIKSGRIYFSVNNVYTFTNYSGVDPEVTRQWDRAGDDDKDKYPTTRRFTVGLDIRF